MKHQIKTILLIILILIILISLMGKQYREYFTTTEFNIMFYSKYQTYQFINNDSDNFISNMISHRLVKDGFKDNDDYKSKSASSAVSFNSLEKRRLTKFAIAVDKLLSKNFEINPSNVPWKFAITEGPIYEHGDPHVRSDVIFVSSMTTDKELMDDCQLGWTLLYMRQNILFGKQIPNTTLPWNATHKDWKFKDLIPTCDFWYSLDDSIYDSCYDDQYLLDYFNEIKDKNKLLASTHNDKNYIMDDNKYLLYSNQVEYVKK